MAFCGGRLGAETAELWCGGEKSATSRVSINADKSFPRNTSTFESERHVSEGAPNRARLLFMYSDWPVEGLRGSAEKGTLRSLFMYWNNPAAGISADHKASGSRNRDT